MHARHFQMFAGYNRWANETLYGAVSGLSQDEFSRDVGAFFGSMSGTLNHLLVADRIWMRRFTGDGPVHNKLDDMPYSGFPELKAAREAEDARIEGFVWTLTDESLAGIFTYTPVAIPEPVTQRLSPALAHFFNHQTHHRGHAHMILSLLGRDPPPLDLIYYQRTDGGRQYMGA